MERPAEDKHSNLLQKFVNYDRNKFNNIGPRCFYSKGGNVATPTFYLFISIMSILFLYYKSCLLALCLKAGIFFFYCMQCFFLFLKRTS
jgi:hypothetical protein